MLKQGMFTATMVCAIIGCQTQYVQADVGWTFSQYQIAQAPAPARPGDASPPQQRNMKQFTEQLSAAAAETKKQLDALNAKIQEGLNTEQRANEIFTGMADAVKAIIDKLGPGSDFRKNLDTIHANSRKLAEENAASQNPVIQGLAGKNRQTAADAERIIREANAEYARGQIVIKDLAQGKEAAVAQIRADALQEAKDAAANYVGIVRGLIDQVETYTKNLKEPAAGH